MDLLSEILDSSGWKTEILNRTSVYGPWGLHFPCDRSAGFHIVVQGSCLATVQDRRIALGQGDILFLSRGSLHDLASDPAADIIDIRAFEERRDGEARTGTPVTTFVSVMYTIPDEPPHPFFLELPEIIHVAAGEIPVHHPLHSTLALISREIDAGIGSDLVIQRLADILLYHVIRHRLETHPVTGPGWQKVFHDEKIRHALEALHRNPAHPWTLEELARGVGLSRASLAARFRQSLGQTPIEYLTRIRIEKGRRMLRESGAPLEDVARNVGYSSAFAFSKAYKRVTGHAPSADRRALAAAN